MSIQTRLMFALTFLLGSLQAQASISIPGSRVVYEEARGWERIALQEVKDAASVLEYGIDLLESKDPSIH